MKAFVLVGLMAFLAGCQTSGPSTTLAEEAGKSLEQLQELRKKAAGGRLRSQLVHSAQTARIPSQLPRYKSLTTDEGTKQFASDSKRFAQAVCTPSYAELNVGLATLSGLNNSLGELSKPPVETFVGISKKIRENKEAIEQMNRQESFPNRLIKTLEASKEDQTKCIDAVLSDLKADFASFEVGVSASFGASLNLLGSALKLLQGIYGAVESGQREQALKRFARIHVHDIEYSLALLDGRVDAPPSNASSVPSLETLREISLPANTTYADMLNKLRAASAHCGFAVYVELQTADTISLAQRYQNAELVLDSIKTFRSVRGTDGNALIKELTTLYRNYFKALEQGASSGAELLDSLSSTQSKISNLLGLWDNFQKARSGE